MPESLWPQSWWPDFSIVCRRCQSSAILLARAHDTQCYRLVCQDCQTANIVAYDWPDTSEGSLCARVLARWGLKRT